MSDGNILSDNTDDNGRNGLNGVGNEDDTGLDDVHRINGSGLINHENNNINTNHNHLSNDNNNNSISIIDSSPAQMTMIRTPGVVVGDKDCVLIGSRNTLRECILSRREELLAAFKGDSA